MTYQPNTNRYSHMEYRRCGNSGLKLPLVSLGLWHNFGHVDIKSNYEEILKTAFDNGITHFDLANNYGPPAGAAEENFGRILHHTFFGYRDEMIISTKAGYTMWPGPYGDWGSKKYLMASLHQSLKRLKLDYVDIFYHHRPDPETPLEETMAALDLIVRQGKALYIGISNYKPDEAANAIAILKQMGTPCLIHQPKFSMLERWAEDGLLQLLENEGVGCIPFSPLAQGLLTNKYLKGIPDGSRASKVSGSLKKEQVTDHIIKKIKQLDKIAQRRNQTLAQMALAWLMRKSSITSVLIGASKAAQISDAIQAVSNYKFDQEELNQIENVLVEEQVN